MNFETLTDSQVSDIKLNIIVIPISRFDGMAGSIRIRNLFLPYEKREDVRISNLIIESSNARVSQDIAERNARRISYSHKNPLSLFRFWYKGIRAINESLIQHRTNVFYIYKDVTVVVFPFLVFASLRGCKVILDITEDNRFLSKKNVGLLSYLKGYTSFLFRKFAVNWIDHYIAISKHLQRMLQKEVGRKNVPIAYIPVTVNNDEFECSKIKSQEELVFFYGGSFGEKDGIDVFIKAFEIVHASYPDAVMNIAGKANQSLTNRVLALIRESSASESIRLLGFISREEYVKQMCEATVHCMTRIQTEYSEAGFPFKLAEMMSTGRPVISAKLNSIVDTVGESALLYFKPNDSADLAQKILDVINNPALSDKLSVLALQSCRENFLARNVNIDPIISRWEKH